MMYPLVLKWRKVLVKQCDGGDAYPINAARDIDAAGYMRSAGSPR